MIKRQLFYGYIVAIAAFLIMIMWAGTRSAFGIFFKPIMNEFGWTRALLSGAFSLLWVMLGLLSIIMGRLNDRFGPRIVVTICGLLLGVCPSKPFIPACKPHELVRQQCCCLAQGIKRRVMAAEDPSAARAVTEKSGLNESLLMCLA